MEDDKEDDANSHSFAPKQVPEGRALSDSEKADALADTFRISFSL
jgi:hypothetical protein